MVVIVHRQGYNNTVEELIRLNEEPAMKTLYPTTYDLQFEDIRIVKDEVKERFKNAYLSQVQYYFNLVWVKIVGLPRELEIDRHYVKSKYHGWNELKTIKQLIMEDTYYIK